MTFSNSPPRPQSSEPSPPPRRPALASLGWSGTCPKRSRGNSDIGGQPYSGVSTSEVPPLACATSAWNAGAKLLDPELTRRKQRTSQFLIDNYRVLYPPFSFPASSTQPRASRISNRQSPELESRLSHRKQRTENFLIAKFRPILPSAVPAALGADSSLRPSPNFRLSTLNSRLLSLIGNEMHSRAESSGCKQRTSHFLIGNEFRSCKSPKSAKVDWSCALASVESRASHSATARCRIPHDGDESRVH
jgi:hypothetical protein